MIIRYHWRFVPTGKVGSRTVDREYTGFGDRAALLETLNCWNAQPDCQYVYWLDDTDLYPEEPNARS